MTKPRTPMEMVETLQSRVTAGARSYRMATVRYLMRPPLSLRLSFLRSPELLAVVQRLTAGAPAAT